MTKETLSFYIQANNIDIFWLIYTYTCYSLLCYPPQKQKQNKIVNRQSPPKWLLVNGLLGRKHVNNTHDIVCYCFLINWRISMSCYVNSKEISVLFVDLLIVLEGLCYTILYHSVIFYKMWGVFRAMTYDYLWWKEIWFSQLNDLGQSKMKTVKSRLIWWNQRDLILFNSFSVTCYLRSFQEIASNFCWNLILRDGNVVCVARNVVPVKPYIVHAILLNF